MLALPFEAADREHRVYVVEQAAGAALIEVLCRDLRVADRGRTRVTVLCVDGPLPERDVVKGLGIELSELPEGFTRGRGPIARTRRARRKLAELDADDVRVHVVRDPLPWRLAARLPRPSGSPQPIVPRVSRSQGGVALVLKSDLGRPSAHVLQALQTAGSLARAGVAVLLAAPWSGGGPDDLPARAGLALADPARERLTYYPLPELSRHASAAHAMRRVLASLAAAGAGVLYFRQARIASLLLPEARRAGFRVFLEAHQPYTTWALHERRRLLAGRPAACGLLPALARDDRQYERRCYLEVDGVICTTRALRRRVRRLASGVPVLLLRNGAPEPAADPLPFTRAARPIDVVYAGRTSIAKGTDVLLHALALLPGATAEVVGGPAATDLAPFRALADRLGIADRVRFLPWEAQDRLFERVRRAWTSVHPLPGTGSREWRVYTSPLKVLEAMALGTPVVATDLPALREIVRDGTTGLLAAPGDPAALAAALRRVLDRPDRAARLCEAALRRARSWSHDARARRLLAFLQDRENAP